MPKARNEQPPLRLGKRGLTREAAHRRLGEAIAMAAAVSVCRLRERKLERRLKERRGGARMPLLEVARERLLQHVLTKLDENDDSGSQQGMRVNKVLITDLEGMNAVKRLITSTELVSLGYGAIQDINKKRQPLNLGSVYLIQPSIKNLQLVSQDFSGGVDGTTYGSCHILATTPISEKAMNYLKSQRALLRSLKTLKEIGMGFVTEASNLFTLGASLPLSSIYRGAESQSETVRELAERLLTVFLCTNDLPAVRYWESSGLCGAVAAELEQQLARFRSQNAAFGGDVSQLRTSQVVILERSFDPRPVFLHELTLEAMAYDLVPELQDGVFSFSAGAGGGTPGGGTGGPRTVIELRDDDPLWTGLRYEHIAEVMTHVSARVRDLAVTKRMKLPEGKVSANMLKDFFSKYPAYTAELKKYQALYLLSERCFNVFKECRLENLIRIEQSLATNQDNEGHPVPDDPFHLLPILNESYRESEKFRVVALFALKNNRGLSAEVFKKIITLASLDSMKGTLQRLNRLGFPLTEPNLARVQPMARQDAFVAGTYELSRYVPTLKELLGQLCNRPLERHCVPFQGPCVVAPKKEESTTGQSGGFTFGKWHSGKPAESRARPRTYVFVVGGVTYSEIRAVHEFQMSHEKYEVVLGGTQVIVPDRFVAEVSQLA